VEQASVAGLKMTRPAQPERTRPNPIALAAHGLAVNRVLPVNQSIHSNPQPLRFLANWCPFPPHSLVSS
jgi:hypothetical protein